MTGFYRGIQGCWKRLRAGGGASRAKVASRVAGVSRHNSAKEVFCHIPLFSFIVVNISIIKTSRFGALLPQR